MVMKRVITTEDVEAGDGYGTLLLPLTPAQAHVRERAGNAFPPPPAHIREIQLVLGNSVDEPDRDRIVGCLAIKPTGPMLIACVLTANRRYGRCDAREHQQGLAAW